MYHLLPSGYVGWYSCGYNAATVVGDYVDIDKAHIVMVPNVLYCKNDVIFQRSQSDKHHCYNTGKVNSYSSNQDTNIMMDLL
jgi:hypothetical protein